MNVVKEKRINLTLSMLTLPIHAVGKVLNSTQFIITLVKVKMNNIIKKKKKAIENGTLIIPNAKPTIKTEKVIQIVRLSLLVFAIIKETKTRQTPKAIIRIFRKIYSSPL